MKNILFVLLLLLPLGISHAQVTNRKIKIFYDCQTVYCETTYLKQNLEAVEFVRDRNFADVHIIILSERNGSGGKVFHIHFIGQKDYKDIQQKYDFSIGADITREQIRQKLLKYIKLGLIPYWYRNGLADKISIRLNLEQENKTTTDKWHHWVFKIGGNAWLYGDSNTGMQNLSGYSSASKVDEKNKFAFGIQYNSRHRRYTYNERIIKSVSESFNINTYRIWGIDQHWSYGIFGRFRHSKYRNYAQSYNAAVGLEYSFFPYKESASRSLVLTSKIGGFYNHYFEKTVYNKTEETLWNAEVELSGNLVKKWGSIDASIDYTTYLHDFRLNSVGFNLGTRLRIAKGLSFNTSAGYSIQHDQINIAAGNLSLEETLLMQKELQSGYDYFISMGLSYSFGSIYNSIVNPRF